MAKSNKILVMYSYQLCWLHKDNYYLIIVNILSFSTYPEFIIIKLMTSETIIKVHNKLFVWQALPETIASDNGMQFSW